MRGASTNSPKSRGVKDLEERVAALTRYAKSYPQAAENLEGLVDPDLWTAYWAKLADLHASLRAAQSLADEISSQIRAARVHDQQ
jgi:hypothetical protein